MRHHYFFARSTPPPRPEPVRPATNLGLPPRAVPTGLAPAEVELAVELRDVLAWLRQRLRGEHTVRASVLSVEAIGGGDALLLLGEAEPTGTNDPPRLKARLDRATARADGDGQDLDPAALVNRTVVLRLATSLRQRFGRGAGVQARVTAVLALGTVPREGLRRREETLYRLRCEGRRFGPGTWREPLCPTRVALIVGEHSDARRDVEEQLAPLVAASLLTLHPVWATFEGPSAEHSLTAAMRAVAALHAEAGVSLTLLVRGGGPLEAFLPLNGHAVAAAACELPNLVTGLGHAATERTAVDEVAARSCSTPNAAAVLVRDLVRAAAERLEAALSGLDASLAGLLIRAQGAQVHAAASFERAVETCLAEAERRAAETGPRMERGLLHALDALAAAFGRAEAPSFVQPAQRLSSGGASGVSRVIVTETGTARPVGSAEEAVQSAGLTLNFADGDVAVRLVPPLKPDQLDPRQRRLEV